MKGNLSQTSWQHLNWLRLGLAIVLVLGIFFRFANLDKKTYWVDEIFTSIHIAGYTVKEVKEQLYTGIIIRPLDIQKYGQTNGDRSVIDTVNTLSEEFPYHPPLYYVLARIWVQWFGDSVATIRSLSAVISLLAFPCIYWLCRELFNSPVVGWVAMGLIAVSPFHVLYAQEARQYSLWTVTILLSSAALLQAIRMRTKLSWVIYSIALFLGLYTHLFTIFVATGHTIYVCASERFRLSKTLIAYLLASLGAIIAFAPWLWLIVASLETVKRSGAWMEKHIGLLSVAIRFFANISDIFVDFNWLYKAHTIYFIASILLVISSLLLSGYSVYFMCRKNTLKVWLFVIILMTLTPLALLIPDLFTGGQRLTISRYVTPFYLAIHLSLAYLLATNMTSSVDNKKQHMWRLLTIVLVSSGLLSCGVISQAEFWNIKGFDYRPLAAIVNQAEKPLVISDANIHGVMTFSYLLDPKVRFQLVPRSNIANIPANSFTDIFLYRPSKGLRLGLEQQQNYNVEEVKNMGKSKGNLWRLEK